MKKLFAILLLTTAFVTASAQSGRRVKNPPPPPPPPPAPQESLTNASAEAPLAPVNGGAMPEALMTHRLQSLDNGTFRLADFNGKVIVINLWATWCGPCRREVPEYEKVRKEFTGRRVQFIALTTEDPVAARNRVEKFVRDFNFGFLIGWADRDTARVLMNGRGAIPQTVVIGSDGRMIDHWAGYGSSSADHLRAAINRSLPETAASQSR